MPFGNDQAPHSAPNRYDQRTLAAANRINFDSELTHLQNSLLNEFEQAWASTELLFSSLRSDEVFFKSAPHGLRYPLAFYYGHPAVFYVNKFLLDERINAPVDARFESIFAVGVDEHSWDDISQIQETWPTVSEIREYRNRVFEVVKDLIYNEARLGLQQAVTSDSHPVWALLMAIEHERIHVETTSVLIREMPLENFQAPADFPPIAPVPSFRAPSWTMGKPEAGRDYPHTEWIEVPASELRLGRDLRSIAGSSDVNEKFGWDCEFGEAYRTNENFEVSRFLTSNGEFSEFVEDGGYRDERLWSQEGWAWKQYRSRTAPMFWVQSRDQQWLLRTLFDEIQMPWNWPAIVNFHEAKAFANWRSNREGKICRLITEGEHHALRRALDPINGLAMESANHSLRFGSETPVDREIHESSHLICDVFGNVWQWCEDIFLPFANFRPHPLYLDYSTPSFDGRHQVLLGGSFMTMGASAGPWNRNNFRRHFYQHAGIRLVRK